MTAVTVRQIIEEWDCRRIYALQELAEEADLGEKEVILAFSRDRKMARVVDQVGSVLTCYAFDGQRYDVDQLLDHQERSFGIRLQLGLRVPLRRAA